jgi:hypothetical protein
MIANRHFLGAVFFALLQVTVTLGTAANLVFCSTASGHVAVESAFDEDCCAQPPLLDAFGIVHADDHCGCVDTPLLQSPVEARKLALWVPLAHSGVLPGFAALDLAGSSSDNRTRTDRPLTPEQLRAARRSVVLLV